MKLYYIAVAIIVLIAGEVILLQSNRAKEDGWATFRDQHACQPLSNTDGSNRAGYLCDDGQVHYRWRQMR